MQKDSTVARKGWKFWIIILAVCVCVVGLGVGGVRVYKHWYPEHLAKQAREFLKKDDFKSAALTARRALQINANSVGATTVMAETAEKIGTPDAVIWRRRVAQLNPSTKESLTWATTALKFGQSAAATEALATVKETARNSAEYHAIAGGVAVSQGKLKDAQMHYDEAVKLDPQNELYQYNAATMQLQLGDEPTREAARATLKQLAVRPRVSTFARRSLALDLINRKKIDEAVPIARDLHADPNATFPDRLMYLDVLWQTKSVEFQAEFSALQKIAVGQPANAGTLLTWMNTNEKHAEAIIKRGASTPPQITMPAPASKKPPRFWEPLRFLKCLRSCRLVVCSVWSSVQIICAAGNSLLKQIAI